MSDMQILFLISGLWIGSQLGSILAMAIHSSAKERRWKKFAKHENDQIRWRRVWQS